MTTALGNRQPLFPDSDQTLTAKIVHHETAIETMMEITKEEDQPKPTLHKIQALQKQKAVY